MRRTFRVRGIKARRMSAAQARREREAEASKRKGQWGENYDWFQEMSDKMLRAGWIPRKNPIRRGELQATGAFAGTQWGTFPIISADPKGGMFIAVLSDGKVDMKTKVKVRTIITPKQAAKKLGL
jgi:hypothetical protein